VVRIMVLITQGNPTDTAEPRLSAYEMEKCDGTQVPRSNM
jgi:hypothetical protein